MVQFFATRRSCITILCVSLLSFAAIILCVASQRVTPNLNVCIFIDSVRELLDTPSYICRTWKRIRESTEASDTQSVGCYGLSQHKPSFREEFSKLLDQKLTNCSCFRKI